MKAMFVLFAIAWGISPLLLLWALAKMWEKAKQLPDAERRLVESHSQGERLKNDLSAAQAQIQQHETNIAALGKRLLKDNVKSVGRKVTANNYATSKKNLQTIFAFCEKHAYPVPDTEQHEILQDLKHSFEDAVKKEWNKQEQARIKRQIREEQKLEAERLRELQRIENEELAIETALQKALQRATDEHDAEVERLKAQLTEAQSRLERAKSMAELTRSGFVYVISNIGSFGEGVFKVGMTRRLEPLDRVRELGDASVPFHYDVHMMVSAEDAPSLEAALHKELHSVRINKVNPRREFFRTDIDTLVRLVEKYHGNVDYVADPEALEYNESANMSEEDYNYVSGQLAKFDEDEEGFRASASPQQVRPATPVSHSASIPPAAETTAPVTAAPPAGSAVGGAGSDVPTPHSRRALACPHCKGAIQAGALVDGGNTCPHCSKEFKVKRKT